ncbi:MAG: hypothetical protein ABIT38_07440 [Gemmatimonadaceae bacterium]
MLSSFARVAAAQLTARDSAALVDAIADRIHKQFGTSVARESFVIVASKPSTSVDVRFAMRVSDAVRARDSSLIVAERTRLTPRIQIGAVAIVAGDAATITLWVARCTETPVIYSGHEVSLAFRRAEDRWAFVERNVGGSGAGSNGCPW